jgi:phosphoribosyl 1,2-cyclic phosphodiesterase
MKLKIVASSSKGNFYILESNQHKLLLECGINIREIKKALKFDFKNIDGCILTHEHGDHSKASNEIMNLGIDLYTSKGTVEELGLNHHRLNIVKSLDILELPGFKIIPFETQHDANESLGYLIQEKTTGETVLFATDTYYIKYIFPGVNYIMVECNYIKGILQDNIDKGLIPKAMYKRLLNSHFELDNVKEFLKAHDLRETVKIILLHLSDGNSDAKRMVKEIEDLTQIETIAADSDMDVDLRMCPF